MVDKKTQEIIMATIKITVNRAEVWNEVAKATDYTGSKLTDKDDKAYDRILLTDSDRKDLDRFWEETMTEANTQLKEMIVEEGRATGDYIVVLHVSRMYDQKLNRSVQSAMTSYFIAAITARWFKWANKDEAESYFRDAATILEEALRKLYSRKRPQRPQREVEEKYEPIYPYPAEPEIPVYPVFPAD